MKRVLSVFLCVALLLTVTTLPSQTANAYIVSSSGTIISGEEYSGKIPDNPNLNRNLIRFELPVPENCIARVIVYTQTDSDTNVYIENENAPYDKADGYGSFAGKNLTAVGDFYNPDPNVFSASAFCCDADSRNTNPYTEVFGDLAAGNYYVVVTGNNYRFKIILEPLYYQGTTSYNNYTLATAANYQVGKEQEGILIANGAVNKSYFLDDQTTYAWYKFNATAGSYKLKLYTDGFFQGTGAITDSTGYMISGMSQAEAYLSFSNPDKLGATSEMHQQHAGDCFTTDFTIAKSGIYYVKIARRTWTSGSYKFLVASTGSTEDGNSNDIEDTDNNEDSDYSEDTDAEVTLSKLVITADKSTVKAGSTLPLQATATYSDESSEVITEFSEWSSSNNKIATVDANGVVKAVAAGTATITANLEGKKATVTITVTESVSLTKIKPAKATVYLKVGAAATNKITAYYSDSTKAVVTTSATYKSSSTNLNVSMKGQMKASKAGTYTVTVTYKTKTVKFKVIVK